MQITGIHHVTAIAGDAQSNVDFYVGVLGLRLVKRTVNFDDPGTYHLYYGDEVGHPGTIMTFFPWQHAARGRDGVGMIGGTVFAIPRGSTAFWATRLSDAGVNHQVLSDEKIRLTDPDGLTLTLSAQEASETAPWRRGDITSAEAIFGFGGVRMVVENAEPTLALLRDVFGFDKAHRSDGIHGFVIPGGPARQVIEVQEGSSGGQMGSGSVHHIAFRVPDDDTQFAWRRRLMSEGYHVTSVQDRQYFRSIYFREPGGVLFELATDPPGFTLDESVEELGGALKLPSWLETRRSDIVRVLPNLDLTHVD